MTFYILDQKLEICVREIIFCVRIWYYFQNLKKPIKSTKTENSFFCVRVTLQILKKTNLL